MIDSKHVSWSGPSLDDIEILPRLPRAYTNFLASHNGFIAFGGGLHVRGAVTAPQWHSVRAALEGPDALHTLFEAITDSDVPFAQDALGDQYILRDDGVWRLEGEVGTLAPLELDLNGFLQAASKDPVEFLGLQPLLNFQEQGGALAPGQLLSVYPPFVIATESPQRSYRAVAASDLVRMLAQFVRETRELPDGTRVRIKVSDA